MTSSEIVKLIRTRLKKLIPTESFQDDYIWKEFTLSKTRVYKNQLSRRNYIAPSAYHKVCLKTQDAQDNECACIIQGCTVKRTIDQVPSWVVSSNNSTLQILTIANKEIPIVKEDQVENLLKYSPGYKNKPVATISNGFIFLYNSSLELIQLKAIWTNPLDLLFIKNCTQCLQDDKDLIQISEDLLMDMVNLTISNISATLNIPTDNTGDNNEAV